GSSGPQGGGGTGGRGGREPPRRPPPPAGAKWTAAVVLRHREALSRLSPCPSPTSPAAGSATRGGGYCTRAFPASLHPAAGDPGAATPGLRLGRHRAAAGVQPQRRAASFPPSRATSVLRWSGAGQGGKPAKMGEGLPREGLGGRS